MTGDRAQSAPTNPAPQEPAMGHDATTRHAAAPGTADGRATRPLISVIMPTFNRAHWVGEALRTLLAQQTDEQFDYEVIVVDNASQDDTQEVLARVAEGSSVPVQRLVSQPPGDAPTRNCGVRAARGEWLAFFDDDQFADPRWLLGLLAAARESGGKIVGGPVLLDLDEQQLARLGRIGRVALREIRFYEKLQPYRRKDLPGTGNALIHRDVFDEVGLFDESMTGGGSDTDLFLHARELGYELWYTPDAPIRHRVQPNRLTHEFLRWDSLSGGAIHASHFDYLEHGRLGLVVRSAARLGQALLVHVPRLVWGTLRRDEAEVLGRRLLLWRAEGYLRGTARLLLPRLCAQHEFFDSLEFRKGRLLGQPAAGGQGPPEDTAQPDKTSLTQDAGTRPEGGATRP